MRSSGVRLWTWWAAEGRSSRPRLAFRAVATGPLARRRLAHFGGLGRLRERPSFFDDPRNEALALFQAERGITVELHPDYLLDAGRFDTPSLQGGPDETTGSGITPRPLRRTEYRPLRGVELSGHGSAYSIASPGQASGRARSISASVATSTSPSAAIASGFERSTSPGSAGHGLRTTSRDLEADGAHRLDGQQRVVDRPEPGRGDDDDREAEVAGEVADQVAERQRDEESADALADEQVGALAGGGGGGAKPLGADRLRRRARPRDAARPAGRSGTARSRRRTAASPRRGAAARGRARRPRRAR